MGSNSFPFQQLPPDIRRLLYTSSPETFNCLSRLSKVNYAFGQTPLTIRQLGELPISSSEIQSAVSASSYYHKVGQMELYRPFTTPSSPEQVEIAHGRIYISGDLRYTTTSSMVTYNPIALRIHYKYNPRFPDRIFDRSNGAIDYIYDAGFTDPLPGLEYLVLQRRTPCVRADPSYAIKRVRHNFLQRVSILRGIAERFPNILGFDEAFVRYINMTSSEIVPWSVDQQIRRNILRNEYVEIANALVKQILRQMDETEDTGKPLL